MGSGLVFCFLGAISFGLLACGWKFAERRGCQASVLVLLVFAWATLVMLLRSAGADGLLSLPLEAVAVAVACGICAVAASYAFQLSIGFGKVSVAWLMANISSAVPAVVSVFMYHEELTPLKIGALALVLVAIYALFHGRREEAQSQQSSLPREKQALWFLLMLVILLGNGMGAYGLKVIAAWGLPEAAKFPYLTVWYGAGLVGIGVPVLLKRVRFHLREAGWSSILAALSIGGQLAMAVALARDVPGHIVFPIALGGSTFMVILGGRFLFGERVNKLTAAGIGFGLIAVILLSLA